MIRYHQGLKGRNLAAFCHDKKVSVFRFQDAVVGFPDRPAAENLIRQGAFHPENTKFGKHGFFIFFHVFVLSCFRDFLLVSPLPQADKD